ncbi:MAG: hypothetical protein H6818_09200 [Phycisphaerales bacterium]|nr:hypothetical protein [Phycisphaerales bacterium]
MPRVLGILAGVTMTLLVLCLGSEDGRRLAVCAYRLFFHVQYGDFDSVSHPPDSIDAIIPCFSLSRKGAARREALAPVDADHLLMAMSRDWGTNVVPDPELFTGHPYQQWAALEVANVAVRFIGVPRDTRQLIQATRFVEVVRRAHPDNGALWLAEGLIYAELGDAETAMELFHEAAARPNWDYQQDICRHVNELLVADGYMPIDAAIFAESTVSPCAGIDQQARSRFDLMLADAIRDDDPTRFTELMALYSQLSLCTWRDIHRPNRFIGSPVSNSGQAAMEALDPWPPVGDSYVDRCERHELEILAFVEYADNFVVPEVLDRVVMSQEASSAYFRSVVRDFDRSARRIQLSALRADSLGNLTLVSVAILCSACLLTLGFSTSGPYPLQSRRMLKIRRWRLVMILPICTFLLCNSIQRRFSPYSPFDAGDPEQLMLGLSVLAGWVLGVALLVFFLKCRHRVEQITLILIIAAIHFSSMLFCRHFQAAMVEAIMARV